MTSQWTWGECKTFSGQLSNDFWTICYLIYSIVTWTFKYFLFHCNNRVETLSIFQLWIVGIIWKMWHFVDSTCRCFSFVFFNFIFFVQTTQPTWHTLLNLKFAINFTLCIVVCSCLSSVHWLRQQSRSRTAWQQSVNSTSISTYKQQQHHHHYHDSQFTAFLSVCYIILCAKFTRLPWNSNLNI